MNPLRLLRCHAHGDWGDLHKDDVRANELAIRQADARAPPTPSTPGSACESSRKRIAARRPSSCRNNTDGRAILSPLPQSAHRADCGVDDCGCAKYQRIDLAAREARRRPVLDRLVADAKRRRFDVMLAWRLDRVGRNLRQGNVLADHALRSHSIHCRR